MGASVPAELINTLPWIQEAVKHIGLKEIPGPQHNKTIQGWLTRLGASWNDDETPWCASFVSYCLKASGLTYPKLFMRALAFEKYGTKLSGPIPGCIVVFSRTGGGHVGFAVGVSDDGKLLVLGGNQSDAVTIAKFGYDRNPVYIWPAGLPVPVGQTLAKQSVAGGVSTKES